MDELRLGPEALARPRPWRVVDHEFSKENGRLDLCPGIVEGGEFPGF